MNDYDKKFIDLDYIILRDRIIELLLDYDRYYTLYDSKKIRYYLGLLLKYLEKGA